MEAIAPLPPSPPPPTWLRKLRYNGIKYYVLW